MLKNKPSNTNKDFALAMLLLNIPFTTRHIGNYQSQLYQIVSRVTAEIFLTGNEVYFETIWSNDVSFENTYSEKKKATDAIKYVNDIRREYAQSE